MTDAATRAEYQERLRTWIADNAPALAPYRGQLPFSLEERVAALKPLHQLMYATGWLRWGWPEEFGGLGGPVVLRGILHEELCRAGCRLPESMLLMETLGPVMLHSAPELARTFFPLLLTGSETWSQGFSEPEAGSDLGSLRCRAERHGDAFVVTGQKIWSSWGHLATRCLLLVRTGTTESRHRGLSFLLVDHDSPGLMVRPLQAANGRNEFAEITFSDVVVPADRLVGAEGTGWASAMYLLQWERGMYAWQRQASLHSELADAVTRAGRSGTPGSDASVSDSGVERLGAAYRSLHALRLASRRTLRSLSEGRNPGPVISVDKILLATAEHAVHAVLRELLHPAFELGGDPDADLLRAEYWYARTASIYGGSAEVQRSILADQVLMLPKEGRA